MVKNIPAVEKGKKYEIRVEVREVMPPPAPIWMHQILKTAH
nr:hypothetical protein [Escherichia coli]